MHINVNSRLNHTIILLFKLLLLRIEIVPKREVFASVNRINLFLGYK